MHQGDAEIFKMFQFELKFLEDGGYRHSPRTPWRAPYVCAQKSVFPLLAKAQLKEEQLSSLCLSVSQIGRLSTQNPVDCWDRAPTRRL
jgi:hypothetical protein